MTYFVWYAVIKVAVEISKLNLWKILSAIIAGITQTSHKFLTTKANIVWSMVTDLDNSDLSYDCIPEYANDHILPASRIFDLRVSKWKVERACKHVQRPNV